MLEPLTITKAKIPGVGQQVRPGTVALLMGLTALGQLGVNLALPALPAIGSALSIDGAGTALVLSSYLLGLAGGQLAAGPLSDRFGRRPVLMIGLAAFVVAGAVSALATSEPLLIASRVAQGAGAAAPLALGRAIARDLFDGPVLIRVTALMTMAMAVVPGLAPALGGLLTDTMGWRVALGSASVAGLAMLAAAVVRLPETNLAPLAQLDPREVMRLYGRLCASPTFLRHALSNALVLAALYAFFAGAPRVLIGPGGLTPAQFGLVPVATSVTYIVGGWLLLRVAARPDLRTGMSRAARVASVAGPVGLLALFLSGSLPVGGLTAFSALYALGLGILLPIGVAGALIPFRDEAGTASALLGALQMAGGGLAGACVGWIRTDPGLAFPGVMLACVLLSALVAPSTPNEN